MGPTAGRARRSTVGAEIGERRQPLNRQWLAAVILLTAYALALAVVSVVGYGLLDAIGVVGLWLCSTWLLGPLVWVCVTTPTHDHAREY